MESYSTRIRACILGFLILLLATTLWAASGNLDPSFAGSGLKRFGFEFGDDFGNAVAVQPDGKVVVAGYSTITFGVGASQLALARFTTNNILDPSFGNGGRVITQVTGNTNAMEAGSAVRIQQDGKIVVGGTVTIGTNSYTLVARFNSDGSVDTSFGQNGIATNFFNQGCFGNALVIQPDGKIIIGGRATDDFGSNFGLARYGTNGVLDPSFGGTGTIVTDANGDAELFALTVQADNKILAVGTGGFDFAVLRYLTNGLLDTSFGPGHNGKVFTHLGNEGAFNGAKCVAIEPGDGIQTLDRIVVAGFTSDTRSTSPFETVRYRMADGALDTSYGGTGIVSIPVASGDFSQVNAVVVQGTGTEPRKIILAGQEDESDFSQHFCLVRLNDNGTLDNSFDGDGRVYTQYASNEDNATCAVLVPGNSLLVAGSTLVNDDNHDFALARYHLSDGSLDNTFNGNGKMTIDMGERVSQAKAMAVQPDGKIVLAGSADNGTRGSGVSIAFARLNADGSFDMSFGQFGKTTATLGEGQSELDAVAIQPDGKIVAAGFNETNLLVVRYTANGFPDPTFNGNGIVTTPVGTGGNGANAITVQSDGKIVIAGSTSGATFAVLRYNTNGTLDTSFNGNGQVIIDFGSGFNQATAVAIQPDGKIVASGYAVFGGTAVDMVAIRLKTNGVGDSSFGVFGQVAVQIGSPGCLGTCMALQPDGKILIGGYSANAGSIDFALVRYTANGVLDPTFNGNGKVTTSISVAQDMGMALGLQSDGKIVFAGSADILGHPEFVALRYSTNGVLDTTYGIGGFAFADFADGGDNNLNALAIDSVGRVTVAGDAAGFFGIARLQADPHVQILSMGRMASGHVLLTGAGVPGATHTVQGSTSLTPGSFSPIGQVTADGTGFWRFEDAGATNLPKRFYRLAFP